MRRGVHPDRWLLLPMATRVVVVVVVAPTTPARDSARGRSPSENRYNAVKGTNEDDERRRTRFGMHVGANEVHEA